MAGIELGGTVKALKLERAKMQGELLKLDKAISVLEGLSTRNGATPNASGHKRTLSPAARNRISKAQKLRWAKVKREQAAKG
jgi:hypothetical protein